MTPLSPPLMEETTLLRAASGLWQDGPRDPACPHPPEGESEVSGGAESPSSWKQAWWRASGAPSCGLEGTRRGPKALPIIQEVNRVPEMEISLLEWKFLTYFQKLTRSLEIKIPHLF